MTSGSVNMMLVRHVDVEPLIIFFQAEDGIRDHCVTGVQTCALPILIRRSTSRKAASNYGAPSGVSRPLRMPDALRPPSGARGGTPPSEIGRASCRERVQYAVTVGV